MVDALAATAADGISRRRLLGGVCGAACLAALSACDHGVDRPKPTGLTQRVVIYGATPAGITAAISARHEGADVLLLHGEDAVGGMVSNGISHSDVLKPDLVSGLAREFFSRVGKEYGKKGLVLDFEPHVAQSVFGEWLREFGVQHRAGILSRVNVSDRKILSLDLMSGERIEGRIFIDASYGGRLVVGSGVTCTYGREGTTDFDESLAGFGRTLTRVDLPGSPAAKALAGVTIPPRDLKIGSADKKLQAYSYRLCLSGDRQNQIAFDRPGNYDRSTYELLARYLRAGHRLTLTRTPLPRQKYDLNGGNFVDTDYIGGNEGFPTASTQGRAEIAAAHEEYVRGMLYFLVADPSVPVRVRKGMSAYGLAADEYVDNNHWPQQLYIRELWRMRGRYVMRQSDLQTSASKPDAIAVGYYPMDSHPVQRFSGDSSDQVVVEGTLPNSHSVTPYEIPMRSIVPTAAEVTNLVVPVSLSCTHVAWTSLRIESTLMALGEASGVMARLATNGPAAVGDIPVATVQQRLQAKAVRVRV